MLYTNQSAFDTVLTHLRQQGCRSMDTKGISCRYRGPGELKCAVGVLIPDSEYTKDLERWTCNEPRFDSLVCLKGLSRPLLRAMQMVHDESDKEVWSTYIEDQFKRIAETYNLNFS